MNKSVNICESKSDELGYEKRISSQILSIIIPIVL